MFKDCPCELVAYESEFDGICTHKACEGDMSKFGCGQVISGISTSPEKCPVQIAHIIANNPSLAKDLLCQ